MRVLNPRLNKKKGRKWKKLSAKQLKRSKSKGRKKNRNRRRR